MVVSATALTLASAATVQAATGPEPQHRAVASSALSLGPLTDAVLADLSSQPVTVTPLDEPVRGPRRTSVPARLRLTPGTLPEGAAAAYLFASRTVHHVAPECSVSPYLLAALGRAASDHGRWRADRHRLDRPGQRLPDTDDGQLDGDRRADHGVGPLRMLPAMWRAAGVDADGDGRRDPRDLDDAALGAAVYLCAASRTGDAEQRVDRALLAWATDPSFPHQVDRLAAAYARPAYAPVWTAARTSPAYAGGGALTPTAIRLPQPDEGDGAVRVAASRPHGTVEQTRAHGSAPAGGTPRPPAGSAPTSGAPAPSTPRPGGSSPSTPTPSEPADPTPSDPGTPAPAGPSDPTPTAGEDTHSLSGRLAWREDVWTVGGTPVDVGSQAAQLRDAAADHDGDGTVESNLDELTGLLGTNLVVEVSSSGRLLMIGTDPYSGWKD